jgi:hypothetical protein
MASPVLVTGGTGRLGKLVVARLRRSGCDVRVAQGELGDDPLSALEVAIEQVDHQRLARFDRVGHASATAGLTLKGPVANTIPPADPYAVRTVPAVKKSTKLTTLEQYVFHAEASAQAQGSAWIIFVFHHLCGAHAHCGPYVISPRQVRRVPGFPAQPGGQRGGGQDDGRVMDGAVKGKCDPVSGTGCDTTPR